jgi:ABC-type dipeptide/oligopeptide/nickel transport system permease subunit
VSQRTGQALEQLQIRRKSGAVLLYENAKRFAQSSVLGAGAAIFLVLVALIAVFASFVAPTDPNAQNYSALLQTPSMDFPMGTDSLGRDTLSRVILGTQLSLFISASAVALSKFIGFTWGILSGYIGGRFDLLSQRLLDVLISFPSVILALLLLVALGAGVNTVIIAIAATGIAGTTRIIRSVALLIRESEYVLAARMIGASPVRVMLRHVAPQCVAPLLVVASASLGGAIFTEAALSYLGLGIPPPDPSWGNMLGGILVASFKPPWWLVVFPGCAITLTILAFNLFGDALRDHLDPRLRGRLE